MAAASQPARDGALLERIGEVLQRARANIEISRKLIQASREYREASHSLIQKNGDLREFLRETVLDVWSRNEQRLEGQAR